VDDSDAADPADAAELLEVGLAALGRAPRRSSDEAARWATSALLEDLERSQGEL